MCAVIGLMDYNNTVLIFHVFVDNSQSYCLEDDPMQYRAAASGDSKGRGALLLTAVISLLSQCKSLFPQCQEAPFTSDVRHVRDNSKKNRHFCVIC